MPKKMKNKETVSENIANILNAAPSGFDEDDEDLDQTNAKVVSDDFVDEEDERIAEKSKFRTQNVDLLESIDAKYRGKIGSRKRLRESSDESEEEIESDDDQSSNHENASESNNEGSEESDNLEDDGDSGEESEGSDQASEDDHAQFKNFNETDDKKQVSKGVCARNQLLLWENLLEIRIQFQKCLSSSNKLPINENFKQFKLQSNEFKDKVAESKKSVEKALDKMLDLQKILIEKYPPTKKILSDKIKDKENSTGSDEEITSEDDDLSESEKEECPSPKKRKNNTEYEKIISNRHDKYKVFRTDTIKKWNDKTQLATMAKPSSNTHTVLNQIEHILASKSKLIKKSQMKRSNYQILGETENNEDEVYNENIFDDDDFYHQLLRELIQFKSSNVTDPVHLSRQWIQLQNVRSKMKRKIDTRATKGRKIRYAVHQKLVNFMAPMDSRNSWTEQAKDELFGSLFGKKQL